MATLGIVIAVIAIALILIMAYDIYKKVEK